MISFQLIIFYLKVSVIGVSEDSSSFLKSVWTFEELFFLTSKASDVGTASICNSVFHLRMNQKWFSLDL